MFFFLGFGFHLFYLRGCWAEAVVRRCRLGGICNDCFVDRHYRIAGHVFVAYDRNSPCGPMAFGGMQKFWFAVGESRNFDKKKNIISNLTSNFNIGF